MKKSKVLVVDDSAFMRKLITDFLTSSPYLEVAATARNGKDALEKIERYKPDVITLDVEMPVMNGLEALRHIMKHSPLPVIMLSSTTKEGADNTITAMNYGAIDFVMKPSGAISLDLDKVKEELIEKVLNASTVSMKQMNRYRSGKAAEQNTSTTNTVKNDSLNWSRHTKKVICIGTSTGGPRALQEVITSLPADVPAPVLIVQHMPAGFTKSLANRLDALSEVTVKEAENDEVLKKGTAYIAPGGFHLKVKAKGSVLVACLDDQEAPRSGHRPSVDVLYESISTISNYDKIAVIMTGMGSDGSKGLVKLKENGRVKAIAESHETSIVFGMPKAAISTNLVDDIENVDNIAGCVMKYMP
jgi:two-component system, chemotaxis family, protein-glutamate methylesterase/glutaminase